MAKTVFVSGATSGIGLATANKLHDLGWTVYAGGLQGEDYLKLTHGITQLPFDISDAEGVAGAVKLLTIEIDHLDALVNNAGIQIPGPLVELPMSDIRRQLDVNVFGHLQVIQEMMPLLRQSASARIVNVSSLMGTVALPLLGAYSMSKHALEAMSDTLRMELAPQGIHVAVIAPGAINTPLSKRAEDDLNQLTLNNSAYNSLFAGMKKTLQSQNKNATAPDAVADLIIHALTSDNPQARYTSGLDVTGLSTIRKLLPKSLGDRLLRQILGIK